MRKFVILNKIYKILDRITTYVDSKRIATANRSWR